MKFLSKRLQKSFSSLFEKRTTSVRAASADFERHMYVSLKRPLSEVLISTDNEKLSLSEGKEKISAIINQLQANGENIGKLKDFLEDERRNLSNANVR